MAIDNRKEENLPLASTSMPQRSEEVEFSLMNNDSAYCNTISGGCDLNEASNPHPMISVSPLPNLNMLGTSQCYNQEFVLAAGNSMVGSSQSNSTQNFHIGQHYISERDSNPHLFRPNSDLPCPGGYIGQPYQCTRNNLTIPNNMMDASTHTSSFEKLNTGRNSGSFVTAGNNSAASVEGLQMANLSGWPTNGNTSWSLPNMNFGMPPFGPYQGVVASNCPENFDGRYVTFGAESNTAANSNTNISRMNVTGSSGREYFPPTNTFHNQMGSGNFLGSGFDMSSAFSGFWNNHEVATNLTQNVDVRRQPADGQKVMFDARPGLSLEPSYAFQRPPESCINFLSSPFGSNQPMIHDIGQGNAGRQPVPLPSSRMIFNQSSSEQQPKYNMAPDEFSSHSYHSSPLVVATSESYPSSLGMPTVRRNLTAQAERPSVSSSLKRVASQSQQAPSIQVKRRKTFTARPFIHPSPPSQTTSCPSVTNNAHTIPPSTQSARLLTPQVTNQFTHPSIHNFAKSAHSVPNMTQTIPPSTHSASSLTQLVHASASLPSHEKIAQSFLPSSQSPCVQHQPQTSQPMPRLQWRAPVIPSTPMIVPVHIKYKEETPEPLGHKCLICKRDLSFTPEGPMFQPTIPPAAAVLPCGHTFHDSCLERITPDDLSEDPPCIPCALGE